jgi:hypothetical protein
MMISSINWWYHLIEVTYKPRVAFIAVSSDTKVLLLLYTPDYYKSTHNHLLHGNREQQQKIHTLLTKNQLLKEG